MATTSGLGTTGLETTTAGVGAGTYGRVILTVKSAHALRDKAFFGKSDPYCVVKLADAEIQTHHVKNAGEACTWDESFSFNNVAPDDQIEFFVYDHNRLLKDAHMGEGIVTLRQLFEEGQLDTRVPLTTRSGTKDAGEVWISLRLEGGARGAGTAGMGTTGAAATTGYEERREQLETTTPVTGAVGAADVGATGVGAAYPETAGTTSGYERREDEYERRSGLESGVGYRESPAVAQQTVATPGIAVASATTPPVARQGEEVVCGQEFFTKVEDRPVIKERVTYVREHHPMEKEFVVETRATGAERETGERAEEHMGATHKVVEVAQPVVEQPTAEYFTKTEDRPVMKERVTRMREHHPVEKEFVVETRATGEVRETGERAQEHMGATERVVEVPAPASQLECTPAAPWHRRSCAQRTAAMASELIDTAQAILTATDTALSKAYREEDRAWRKDDLAWREQERQFMQQQLAWRQEDLVQRELDNARVMWARHVEKNRRDVEERAEQLKAISNLSALIAGFALVSFLQFDFSANASSEGVQLAFGLTIALTVLLEGNAMVLCSLIHASILKSGRQYVSSQEEAEFMARARQFAASFRLGDRPPAPRRNFQAHWQYACEGQWRLAFFMFMAGMPVFFVNMALASWIKFSPGEGFAQETAATMTAVMALSLAIFLVAQNQWTWHLIGGPRTDREEALPQPPPAGLPWDWHRRPLGGPSVLPLGAVVGRRPAAAGQRVQPSMQQARRSALAAAQRQEAAPSSSAAAAGGSPAATATLLQRLVAGGSLADRSTLLLAAALGGALLFGAAEPAAAADGSTQLAHAAAAQPLGDLAENADFWGNVLRYVSYFFSVLLGTAYIAIRPIIELLKRPGTAVLVVAGIAGLVYFVSFTVQAMLGINEPIEYTASSIVTPQL
ncbi:Calcium release-activated calcium channel isoform A [Chlorella sorokiniana]|uniref:Uncharacterized protein ycf33 n=1 Tax=Chlorella sorokiniana TaxID=3076 RepID=A0A2P6TZJ0_CHLSO|nr:Calcium release-activated calcium channel isoform A [Chlorella sorokiniana]|eukprot:PRW59460.1 Calcium release-activated calcium channel isoform A [Chlorella sorokiniana]